MDLYLIGFEWLSLSSWLWVLQVAVGLGMVIFVHELGHFMVAKWCGVKCEKFFVGFDIGGWKISKQWGETEYGIGILPLGGYVKMLGQEDNPYRAADEMERAKIAKEADGSVSPEAGSGDAPARNEVASDDSANDRAASDMAADDKAADSTLPEDGEASYELDPRSYQAQSVPKRMAIISAGVIMNVIFAFVISSIAYGMGVKYTPCVVGRMIAGDPAWMSGLRVGDDIIKIGDVEEPRFRDLRQVVAFGDHENGVQLMVRRAGVEVPLKITVHPHKGPDALAPQIGMSPAVSRTLSSKTPTVAGSPAAAAKPAFHTEDKIVAIGDVPIATRADLSRELAVNTDATIRVTVERKIDSDGESRTETIPITVGPNPMRRLGIVMHIGRISAVQPGSPADKAGLKAGDSLTRIEAGPGDTLVLDPITLPHELRRRAQTGRSLEITVLRDNKEVTLKNVELTQPQWDESPFDAGQPMSAPALGIAYHVINRVESITEGGPAAASGKLQPDAEITRIKFIQPEIDDIEKNAPIAKKEISLKLGVDHNNWPFAIASVLQHTLPGTVVELTVAGQTEPVVIHPEASANWNSPQRGFFLQSLDYTRKANSFGEAMALGRRETWESLTLVVTFLRKIGRQISAKAAGGPITIFDVAFNSAKRGFPTLLVFLAMLSANLAIINSLPIPVLDGGHFVFLTLEGVMRRPVSEKVFLVFTYMGFAFIVTLMVCVLSLDISRLF